MRELNPSDLARDFGGLTHAPPRRGVAPSTADDAVSLLSRAELRCAIRGMGHSQSSATLRRGGLIVATHDLVRPCVVDGATRAVTIGGGASWRDVVDATMRHELTPPVLTDNLDTSVGGTLSVGGVGASSFRFGAQVDQCLELHVGLPTGRCLRASATENPDVFRCVLGGQGQIGIILNATLRLIDARGRLWSEVQRFGEIEGLLHALGAHIERPDVHGLEAGSVDPSLGGGFELTILRTGDPGRARDSMTHGASSKRHEAMMAALSRESAAGGTYPWLDMIVPWAATARFVHEARRRLPGVPLLMWPVVRPAHALNVMVCPRYGTPVVLVTVLAHCRRGRALTPLLRGLRAIHDAGLALGGTRYPSGWPPMTRDERRNHLGESWACFEATRSACDPRSVLALD